MNEKVYKVLMGFIRLSESERALFIEELNKFQRSDYFDKQTLKEGFEKRASVGPKDSVCTCCGR